jgi:hypothetical protein
MDLEPPLFDSFKKIPSALPSELPDNEETKHSEEEVHEQDVTAIRSKVCPAGSLYLFRYLAELFRFVIVLYIYLYSFL